MGSLNDTINSYDIIIIGAGLAGINCAYRIKSQLPNARFTILEGRDTIGGTWDLFKYPGIRSDSDLQTYGFAWEPWPYDTPVAEGPLIMTYLRDCVSKYDLEKHIDLQHKVTAGDWSSEAKKWTLTVDNNGHKKVYETSFLTLATGYFDYDTPREVEIPGLDNFKGKVIHPQFWPTDYDFSDKEVVVVGSGATAITLIPALAPKTKHVTMLQRSPTYIITMANSSPWKFGHFLPKKASLFMNWLYFAITPFFRVLQCFYFPDKAKKAIIESMQGQLPADISVEPHFTPSYNPWEQRVCITPNGDFFKCLHEQNGKPAKASIITGNIETVVEDGIACTGGEKVPADVIVTATGLKLCWAGKIPLRVDGELITPGEHAIWNGCMVNDVPNLVHMHGYAWASWTLGVDNSAITLVRLWKSMQNKGQAVATPKLPAGLQIRDEDKQPWLSLTSSYIKTSQNASPFNLKDGKGPWKGRGNVWVDWIHARFGNIGQALKLD